MKKKLLATLSIAMVLSLAACSGETASYSTSVADTEIEASDNADTEEIEETEAADEDEETDVDVSEEAPKQNGVFGYVDGGVYTNEYLGIQYLASPGYAFLDDSYIGRLTDAGTAIMDDEAAAERLESGASVVEFVLTDSMMTSSVNFVIGKHDTSLSDFSKEDLAERLELMVPILTQKYENMGAKDIVCEMSTATLLGEEVPCILLKVNYLGTEINMLETFILKDNYSCTITVQASSDEKISQLLSFFVPIQ